MTGKEETEKSSHLAQRTHTWQLKLCKNFTDVSAKKDVYSVKNIVFLLEASL